MMLRRLFFMIESILHIICIFPVNVKPLLFFRQNHLLTIEAQKHPRQPGPIKSIDIFDPTNASLPRHPIRIPKQKRQSTAPTSRRVNNGTLSRRHRHRPKQRSRLDIIPCRTTRQRFRDRIDIQ